MINALLNGILSLIIGLVSTLLSPIDLVIEKALPDLAYALDSFNSFMNYIEWYIVWAADWTFLNYEVRSIIVAYFTFILTVPLAVSTIKLAIKWYEKLKP